MLAGLTATVIFAAGTLPMLVKALPVARPG
jgi:hypothetical protein